MTIEPGRPMATGLRFSILADGLEHPEGIAWGPDGRLYAGGEGGQVYAVGLDGSVDLVAETDGSLLGVALDGGGRVYACDATGGRILRVTPGDGSFEVVSSGPPGSGFTLPNALAFDRDGVLYATDSGHLGEADGRIVAIDPSDGRTRTIVGGIRGYPNGCCMGGDGRSLFVVLSEPGVIASLDPLAAEPGPVLQVVAETPVVPDGCAFDREGGLIVSCYRPDRIYRIDPDGAVAILADDPQGRTLNVPTNVAFCGDGLGLLAAANVGEDFISIAAAPVAGQPLFYPRPA